MLNHFTSAGVLVPRDGLALYIIQRKLYWLLSCSNGTVGFPFVSKKCVGTHRQDGIKKYSSEKDSAFRRGWMLTCRRLRIVVFIIVVVIQVVAVACGWNGFIFFHPSNFHTIRIHGATQSQRRTSRWKWWPSKYCVSKEKLHFCNTMGKYIVKQYSLKLFKQ